jgi:hypothetical protein
LPAWSTGIRKSNGLLVANGCTTLRFIGCEFSRNGIFDGAGARVDGFDTGIAFIGCLFDSNLSRRGALEGNALELAPDCQCQVIGCVFRIELASGPNVQQLLFATAARSPLIQGCWFEARGDVQALRAVRLSDTRSAKMSGNVVRGFSDPETGIVDFTGSSVACVEYGNHDVDSPGMPRIGVSAPGSLFGLSRGAVECLAPNVLPPVDTAEPGSLVWQDDALWVLVPNPTPPPDRMWRKVVLTPL